MGEGEVYGYVPQEVLCCKRTAAATGVYIRTVHNIRRELLCDGELLALLKRYVLHIMSTGQF